MESPSTSKPQPTRETRSKDGATRAETAGPTPSTPGPVASFVRFVVCGGGVGLLAGAAVPLLATLMPWALANAVVSRAVHRGLTGQGCRGRSAGNCAPRRTVWAPPLPA
ncbi:hypothetical protein SAURM35S_05252 [Streptomyces aurantiogriseus]